MPVVQFQVLTQYHPRSVDMFLDLVYIDTPWQIQKGFQRSAICSVPPDARNNKLILSKWYLKILDIFSPLLCENMLPNLIMYWLVNIFERLKRLKFTFCGDISRLSLINCFHFSGRFIFHMRHAHAYV
jgi:hypothetical protein